MNNGNGEEAEVTLAELIFTGKNKEAPVCLMLSQHWLYGKLIFQHSRELMVNVRKE